MPGWEGPLDGPLEYSDPVADRALARGAAPWPDVAPPSGERGDAP